MSHIDTEIGLAEIQGALPDSVVIQATAVGAFCPVLCAYIDETQFVGNLPGAVVGSSPTAPTPFQPSCSAGVPSPSPSGTGLDGPTTVQPTTDYWEGLSW